MNEEAKIREITLAVRDWGQGLANQRFDDDQLPGMSPQEATTSLLKLITEARLEELERLDSTVFKALEYNQAHGRGGTGSALRKHLRHRYAELKAKDK